MMRTASTGDVANSRQHRQRRQPHVNVRVVHGALDDGEQFGAGELEVANAVQRHLARVAVACRPRA